VAAACLLFGLRTRLLSGCRPWAGVSICGMVPYVVTILSLFAVEPDAVICEPCLSIVLGQSWKGETKMTVSSPSRLLDFSGKVVLVTGAGTGSAQASPCVLPKPAPRSSSTTAPMPRGQAVLARIEETGCRGLMLQADVTVRSEVERLVARVLTTSDIWSTGEQRGHLSAGTADGNDR